MSGDEPEAISRTTPVFRHARGGWTLTLADAWPDLASASIEAGKSYGLRTDRHGCEEGGPLIALVTYTGPLVQGHDFRPAEPDEDGDNEVSVAPLVSEREAAEAAASAAEFSATLRKGWVTVNEELASRKSPLMFEFIDARVETDEEHNERIRRDGVAWVSYSFGGKVGGPTLVQHPDGRREMFGGTHENPWASRSTTLPDMVPAAVLARRPPARIPTPTDLDDHLIPDAEPTGSIVRRS